MVEKVLADQIAYYRARAPEFDEWYGRTGMCDLGEHWNRRWREELGEVEVALDAFGPVGRVLDLACGTGYWTQLLAPRASSLTAVDASPEVLSIAQGRVDANYVNADLFAWNTDELFDTIFFGFWLSHVPSERFEWFWEFIDRALAPNGRVFFVDNLYRPLPDVDGEDSFWKRDLGPDGTALRSVSDGREFRIVKNYYEPEDLHDRLEALGWDLNVRATEWFFYYGFGGRADG